MIQYVRIKKKNAVCGLNVRQKRARNIVKFTCFSKDIARNLVACVQVSHKLLGCIAEMIYITVSEVRYGKYLNHNEYIQS